MIHRTPSESGAGARGARGGAACCSCAARGVAPGRSRRRVGEAREPTVRDYWTRARMRAAEPRRRSLRWRPAPGSAAPAASSRRRAELRARRRAGTRPPRGLRAGTVRPPSRRPLPDSAPATDRGPGSGPGYRAHGKVFFTIPSGRPATTSARGPPSTASNRSVVWTAGHCVFDAGRATRATRTASSTTSSSSPPTRTASRPTGTGRRSGWRRPASGSERPTSSFDLGAAVVAPSSAAGACRASSARAASASTSRATSSSRRSATRRAAPRFDGEREYRCTGRPDGTDDPAGSGPAHAPASTAT